MNFFATLSTLATMLSTTTATASTTTNDAERGRRRAARASSPAGEYQSFFSLWTPSRFTAFHFYCFLRQTENGSARLVSTRAREARRERGGAVRASPAICFLFSVPASARRVTACSLRGGGVAGSSWDEKRASYETESSKEDFLT
jgi:hypothetical protein